MMNIEEEKEIVEKMKKKGNSEVEYAEGMLSVLSKIAEGMSPEQVKAYVNNTLRCLENE
jgi:flagellar motor component MotA